VTVAVRNSKPNQISHLNDNENENREGSGKASKNEVYKILEGRS